MSKKVIRCIACSNVVREYGGHSYVVEMQERVQHPLTGEINVETVRGRICKSCAIDAGYKVRRGKDGKK